MNKIDTVIVVIYKDLSLQNDRKQKSIAHKLG
jgi:hypothetical protein